MAHIIQGTWDDIKGREAELVGHRLLLIVDPEVEDLAVGIPAPPFSVTDRSRAEELILEGLASLEAGNGIEATAEYWAGKQRRVVERLGPA